MAIDPFTGDYTSPFAQGGAFQGLPRFAPLPYANPAGTMVGRAIGRGVDTLQQNIGSSIEGVGGSLGLGGVQSYGADIAARNAAEVAKSARLERPDAGVAGYLASTVGENAPQAAISAGLPAIGAAIGSVVPGLGTAAGFGVGTGASALLNYLMLAGENRETQKRVSPGAPVNEAAAFGAAVPGAALETLSGAIGGKLLTGGIKGALAPTAFFSRATAANAAKMAAVGAASEVPTEVGQQALTRAQAGQNLADREAFGEYFDAGLGAAVLGGIFGGAGSARTDYVAVRQLNAEAVENDKLKGAVDQSLSLPETPALVSKINALASPEQMLAPMGGPETPLERPFAKATDADLLSDLAATEQRLATGGATQDDARNLRMLRAERAAREAQFAQPPLPEVDPQLQMFGRGVDALVGRQEDQLQSELAGGGTTIGTDVADLEANRAQSRELRAEELRQTIDRMNAEDQQRQNPMAQQETKSLRQALKALDEKAKEAPLDANDIALQKVLATELETRAPSEATKQALRDSAERQGELFDEYAPATQRARTQAEAQRTVEVKAVKARAKELGLNPQSSFAKSLNARTEEELIDTVLDNQNRTGKGEPNQKGSLDEIAFQIGVGRDFDAEIAKALADREAAAKTAKKNEADAKKFVAAQAKMAELEAAKAKYQAALQRQKLRQTEVGGQIELAVPAGRGQMPQPDEVAMQPAREVQFAPAEEQLSLFRQPEALPTQVAPQEQIGLPGLRNLPEQQAPAQEGQPIVPEALAETAPQIRGQAELRLMPPEPLASPAAVAPRNAIGAALQARARDEQFSQAMGQRLEQQAPAAELEQAITEIEPITVTETQQSGNTVRYTLSRGAPVVLERKGNAWYEAGRFIARNLSDAKKVAIAQRSDDRFLFRAANYIADDVATLVGPARLAAVRDAVSKITQGWSGRNQVTIVQNFDALPEDVKLQLAAQGDFSAAPGFVSPDGAAYMIADNITSRSDAVATLFHEVLTHKGFRLAFERDRVKLLQQMYDSNQSVRDLVQSWKELLQARKLANGVSAYDAYYANMPTALHVEEALALMSEQTGPLKSTLMGRMRALYAKYAAKLGFKKTFSDQDVRALVAEAHRRAMKEVVAQRAPTIVQTATKPVATRGPVANAAEIQQAANTYGDAVTAAPMLRAAAAATSGTTDDISGFQTVVGRLMRVANVGERKLSSMSMTDVRETARPAALYFQSMGHLAQQYGKFFPMLSREGLQTNALKEIGRADDLQNSITQTMSRIANRIPEQVSSLSQSEQDDMFTLMSATFNQLDPDKKLEEHTHLTPAQQVEKRAEYDRVIAAKNRLGKASKLNVYRDARALNDATYFQQMTLDLYDVIVRNADVQRLIPSAKENAVLEFNDRLDLHNSPAKVREFWADKLGTMIKETEAAVTAIGRRQVQAKDMPRITSLVGGLQQQLKKTAIDLNGMKRYPYFHLGRFGKFYATFRMPRIRTADGRMIADPKAVEAVAEALHQLGLDNIEVSETTEAATVFIRTDHRSVADALVKMATELQQTGSVDAEKVPTSGEVDAMMLLPESARRTLTSILDQYRADHAPLDSDNAETRQAKEDLIARTVSDMTNAFLARLPDSSVSKVMARRGFKSGFDKDMMRAFAQRMQIAANSTATRVASEIKGRAIKVMQDQIKTSTGRDKWSMTTVLREIMKREQNRADTTANNFVDALKAFNHNWFLSLNPGYWMTQIVQLQTNVWPELVKSGVSYKRAFSAIAGNFPTAFKLVRAAIREANKQGLLQYGADATVTLDVLKQITLDADPAKDAAIKEFVLRMFLRGSIDVGSPTRELGRAAEGRDVTKFDKGMLWASSGSYYLEMMTRLNAALAAREIAMEKGMSVDETVDYAADVVSESMMNYTEANRARAFSRKGMAGQFTPLGTAFLTFQFLMLEKYSREIGTAFINGAATAAEKKAARRWLGSHLTAMTAVAGGLGLPFVTVVARVIEGLVDLLDDDEEPYNAKVAMRNFTADMFGNDVAEVLMRGLPRAVGFDISGRVGAADIMPFSKLLADRREWRDALSDFTFRTAGAPLSMATSMATGMGKIADGQFFDGMKEIVPVALKNPMEAVKIGTKGITDSKGNLLPIDPGTMDIIWQSLGLTPQARAEYSEANFAQTVRRSVTMREASEVRKKIITAVQIGDRQAMRDAIAEARAFDAASPSFAIMPSLASSIAQAQQRTSKAKGAGTELGVKLSDKDAIALTRFSNY